jgi:3-methyladenine DNA glycosylase/8-oxoguanine DNA glycosylase
VLETVVRPAGPYRLDQTARQGTDRTRTFCDGVFTCVFEAGRQPAMARVWQGAQGDLRVVIDSKEPAAALDHLRFILAVEDDHTEFLRRFGSDPLIGLATFRRRGLRPLRTGTVTHALLRALCGQLITAREARHIEGRLIAAAGRRHAGLDLPPTRETFAPWSPARLSSHGLVARKASALIRISRAWDVERLRGIPTAAAVRRVVEERTLGPWSAGVICLEGLGRYDHGLVGDLGLMKLCTTLLGREAIVEDTAELLAGYGEWAGLASVYLLGGATVPAERERLPKAFRGRAAA